MMFTFDDFVHPQLSPSLWALLRTTYGLLLSATLWGAYRHGRRFFLSERWGGYAQSSRDVDVLHNPRAYYLIAGLWFASAIGITIGKFTVPASLVNLAFCYYFFVHMRWKGVLRGMGAPGFMTYHFAAATFLMELTSTSAPSLRSTALLLVQADYALIMLSAGLYKMTAGYPSGNGMELGMVNPQWGFFHRFFSRFSPKNPMFFVLNQLAWSLEVLAAIMMFVPPLRMWGGLLMVASFAAISMKIKLGNLCGIVIIGGLMFVPPESAIDVALSSLVSNSLLTHAGTPLAGPLYHLLAAGLTTYLVLLPFAHAGLFFNFYAKRSFPAVLQRVFERYTNLFGLIIWRVFSSDHTNFYIHVYRAPRVSPETLTSLSDYDRPRGRFRHVGECIALTSLFTTLKYYPSNNAIFQERVLRYSRTIPHGAHEVVVFRYFSLRKGAECFESVLAAEFVVDVAAATVEERALTTDVSVRRASNSSPLHEGRRPGSYVALRA
jgi:hypothetical protein